MYSAPLDVDHVMKKVSTKRNFVTKISVDCDVPCKVSSDGITVITGIDYVLYERKDK